MSIAFRWRVRRRPLLAAILLAAIGWAAAPPIDARQAEAPRLTFYPSLQLRFVDGQARNFFISNAGVVNVSGVPLTNLTLRQTFPDGFTPSLIAEAEQALLMRPEGFQQSLEGNVYTVVLPELRIAEATALVVELRYQGRPGLVAFPGIEVEFESSGGKHTEKGPDLTWDLSQYTRYSGTLREFIRRYAGIEITIPSGDWGFSNLAARIAGRVATGPVAIEAERGGRMRFSLQAGTPGDLRRLLIVRRPYDPARHDLKAQDEVRRMVMDSVAVTSDFNLDIDAFAIEKRKVGRHEAWVADTRWIDKVKDRLGEGPSRWYVITDVKRGEQLIINASAQGRGVGTGKADVPNPGKEAALMSDLEKMVASIRLL